MRAVFIIGALFSMTQSQIMIATIMVSKHSNLIVFVRAALIKTAPMSKTYSTNMHRNIDILLSGVGMNKKSCQTTALRNP